MEITQHVRDYAARLNEAAVELAEETTLVDPKTDAGDAAARQAGMDEMSRKFRELGGDVYVDAGNLKHSSASTWSPNTANDAKEAHEKKLHVTAFVASLLFDI